LHGNLFGFFFQQQLFQCARKRNDVVGLQPLRRVRSSLPVYRYIARQPKEQGAVVLPNRALAPHPVKAQKAILLGFQRIVFVSQQSPGVPIQPRVFVAAKLLYLVERILRIHENCFGSCVVRRESENTKLFSLKMSFEQRISCRQERFFWLTAKNGR
jgi:hypothetical protein